MEPESGWVSYLIGGIGGAALAVVTGLLKEATKDRYPWAKHKLFPRTRPATQVERTYEPRGASALRSSWVAEAKMHGAKARGYRDYLDPEMKTRVFREAGSGQEFMMINADEPRPLD